MPDGRLPAIMIKQLAFFNNGCVWASDERGFQVAEEQEPAWLVVIREKLARGVIDEDTKVMRSHYNDMTVGEILRIRAEANHIWSLAPPDVRASYPGCVTAESVVPLAPVFSTREGEGGENILKNGQIEIGWKASEQLLPSETANFREALTNLLGKFQKAGAQITVATFADGSNATPVNLVEAGAHVG
jgi:hypothetical protein